MFPRACALFLAAASAACSATPSDPAVAARERDLAAAQARWRAEPDSVDACVWVGRRLGYLGRYEEAIEVFTRGLERHPDDPWLLRFRGHRWITLRRFDAAIEDLERADRVASLRPDEVEPDGQPNAAGVPIGTLRSNIDYHLGLALMLSGDLERAERVYALGAERARANDDRLVSHAYWWWIVLKRLGREARAAEVLAATTGERTIIENDGYHALVRHFRGELSREELLRDVAPGTTEFATRGFGAAMKLEFDGRAEEARELLATVVASGPMASFGCIAAERSQRSAAD